MEDDANDSLVILFESPGLVDRGDFACFVCEDDMAHGQAQVSAQVNPSVFDFALFPAFEGEPAVTGVLFVATYEVCEGSFRI